MHNCERETVVMIFAGGTGGHVFPALVVAQRLARQVKDIIWVGTRKGLETTIVPAAGFRLEIVTVPGVRDTGLAALFAAPWRLTVAIIQVWRLLLKYKPDVAVGMGGFASAAGGLMAAALNVPLVIHEQNAVAGRTNRLLARISTRILLGFPDAMEVPNAQFVGNPVRPEISRLPEPEKRLDGRAGALNLLVIGGSQGASIFNDIVPQALAVTAPEDRPQVRQQTGKGKLESTKQQVAQCGVSIALFEFCDDIAAHYAWADLVLCRAGALSVAELSAAGVASILVPYPFSSDDHQAANAHYLGQAGAALVIEQRAFTVNRLASLLAEFSNARHKLIDMAVRARRLTQTAVAEKIAAVCLEVCKP